MRATLRSPIGVKPMNLFLEILRLSMYVTGIARNLYAIWREYKQQRIAKRVIEKGRLQPTL